jgi:hypothetical protein
MPGSLLYEAGYKLELLLGLCARRYESQAQRQGVPQDAISEEADLDELDDQLKQFGRVIWFFGDTNARLDGSSFQFDHLVDFASSSFVSQHQQQQFNGSNWESVWQNLFGDVQIDAIF